jgi:hypothetical protein
MTLSPLDLQEKVQTKSKMFISKMGGKNYRLYGYIWNPDKK